ncbi:glycoside hydrolase family 31 protein [Halosimplex amylolyticum]|uniref:glycoside hydrolase family 31 protein n=1 Tax=Halosimplex amylolyticum TaxID=3396616 RepID=UPI003F54FD4A
MHVDTLGGYEDGPLFDVGGSRMKLQVLDDAIVRLVYTAGETIPDPESPMVVEQEPVGNWDLAERDGEYELTTAELSVLVDRETAAITWRDADGRRLVSEPDDGGKSVVRVSPEDLTVGDSEVATPRESLDREAYSTRLDLEFADDEAILGLGQHDDGVANYRGEEQTLYQGNTKVAMPAFLSTRGYGMLWNTGSLTSFHDDQHGSFVWTECDDALDVFFVAGEPDAVISGFRQLTGESTMLPKWSYGYVQSKERYKTAEELVEVVDEYRERDIPIDCIVQDWQYWPDTEDHHPNFEEWDGPEGDWGQWGQKSFHPERFPDPSATMDDLHERNVRLMISIWPNMLAGENYDEMSEAGHVLDDEDVPAPGNEQRYYNAFSEEARDIYWNQAKEGLFDHGVDAWWCDSTEPYDPTWTLPTAPEPHRLAQHTTDAFKHVLDPGYLNTYSLHQAKGMYEGQREATDDKRVINLTRSGYPGQQRYGAITWSGDIEATWERYRTQIADGLQFTAAGNPKWTLDIGAFFAGNADYSWIIDGDFDEGNEDAGYRELYVRWFQYGAFLPLFRSHGTHTAREMWRFGEPGERTYDTLVTFDRLRYRLLPYIYSLAGWETHRDYTMYRHLALEFPDDEAAHEVGDQFMFGPAFMVCPVTEPMYYGPDSEPLDERAEAREVYLPGGVDWYDFWTGERYDGGQTILADAPLEKVPLFVKAGSVVPMGPVVQHTGERPDADWELRVYPGRDGEFDVYEDAGDGYDYEDGAFAFTPIRWEDAASELTIGDRDGSFPKLVEERDFEIVVVGENCGVGVETGVSNEETVTYDGSETTVGVDR